METQVQGGRGEEEEKGEEKEDKEEVRISKE